MPTKNITVTSAWTLVANTADDPVIVSSQSLSLVQFATSATETDPTVTGHVLELGIGRDALTPRGYGMAGYLYAKVASGGPSIVVAVDGSTVGD